MPDFSTSAVFDHRSHRVWRWLPRWQSPPFAAQVTQRPLASASKLRDQFLGAGNQVFLILPRVVLGTDCHHHSRSFSLSRLPTESLLSSHFRTAEQQVALSEEQGLTSDGDRQELLQWLVASRDWCTPLHHLAAGTALARAQLPYARALDLLRDGASVHERARPDAPSPLDLARANPEGEVASLILLIAEQWSPSTHRKFPYEAQRYAVELLWLGVGLAAQVQEHGYFALIDVWLAVVMPAVIDVGSGVRAVPEAAPTEAQWERV